MNDLLLVILLGLAAAAVVFGVVYGSGALILHIVRWRRDKREERQADTSPDTDATPVAVPAAQVETPVHAEPALRFEEAPQVAAEPVRESKRKTPSHFPRRAAAPQAPQEAPEPQVDTVAASGPQPGAERFPRVQAPAVVLSEPELEAVREDPELQATVARAVAADRWHTEAVETDAYPSGDDHGYEPEVAIEEPVQETVPEAEPEVAPKHEPEVEETDEPEPEPAYQGLKVDPFAALRASMNRR
jgi:hypothetical protein